jgi:hypothetical protein
MITHARLLVDFFGEKYGLMQIRKFTGWYLKGFVGTKKKLPELHKVKTLDELDALLVDLPRELPYPITALRARRCKHGKTQTVSLPEGFLEARDEDLVLEDPEHLDGG